MLKSHSRSHTRSISWIRLRLCCWKTHRRWMRLSVFLMIQWLWVYVWRSNMKMWQPTRRKKGRKRILKWIKIKNHPLVRALHWKQMMIIHRVSMWMCKKINLKQQWLSKVKVLILLKLAISFGLHKKLKMSLHLPSKLKQRQIWKLMLLSEHAPWLRNEPDSTRCSHPR